MAKTKKLPLVAICGRPNVGKSTLFNRIIKKSRAIVHDLAGITRDRFFAETEWQGRRFRVVDTGGMMDKPSGQIEAKMQEQVHAALEEACLILFVVDGQHPLTRLDHEVAHTLFKYEKPRLLVVNKLDNAKIEENKYEFYELGMGDPVAVSSGHNLGIEALRDLIIAALPPLPEGEAAQAEPEAEDSFPDIWEEDDEREAAPVERPKDPRIKVAIVGKPNVGKSSFVNAILNEERTIVSDIPGTTRDAIDVDFHWKDQDYLLIDTAGLRKKAGIKQPVEHFSVSRSLRAVKRADVVLLMVDPIEGLTEQDKRIIGYTRENGTAMVIAWTKWDLVEDKEKRFKELSENIDLKMPQIKHVPMITISNLTRQRLFNTFEIINKVAADSELRIPTAELNKVIEEVKAKHNPPSHGGTRAKILYATQTSVKPTEFVLFVNQARLFHFSYMRYIENQIRAQYGFDGVPIKLELREGKAKHER